MSAHLPTWHNAPIVFNLLECGGGGDCLFHVLAAALNLLEGTRLSMVQVREWLANCVKVETLSAFCDMILDEQRSGRARGSANMERVIKNATPKLLETLQALIKKPGRLFQGTDGCLRWLLEHHPQFVHYGFVIFSSWGYHHTQVIETPKSRIYILIFNNAHTQHWQLVAMSEFIAVEKHLVEVILSA
uniref:OTU domain-containing protein n=1 Tax=viral metagenome TaxID=1070528 RepID=A0A6C0BMI3_9ZZZZ